MATYRFEGVTKDGKREMGTIQASSEKEVRKALRARGLRPKKITPPSILEFDLSEWMVEKGYAAPFGQKELLQFTKQLAIMVSAGVPIIQCLDILYRQEKHPVLKKSIKKIATDVSEGKAISEALEPLKGFDRLYCNLVRAGEAGGILDTILEKLTGHMEKQEKIKSQVKAAMMYPGVVTTVGIGVIWAMMLFVVPQFVGMLQDTGQEPPWITQLVIDASKFLENYSLYLFPSVLMVLYILNSWRKTPSGKVIFDKVMMKMPIFGGIIIKGNLGSFTRTLGTMLGSGVALVDALDICIETIDNGVISDDLKKVKKKVVEGKTLTEPLNKIEYFPPMVSQMISVGEQTGQIDGMLDKVSDVLEDEVENLVGAMTKMMEPIIIVVLGGIIAGILVAMYLPMFMAAGG
jgi:type IV pilus assembly protein PilC